MEEQKIKIRTGNITVKQKYFLMDFMESHPQLMSGKFTPSFTFKKSRELWQEVAELLNSMGAKKNWRQWRKAWQDIRSKTKSKQVRILKHKNKISNGQQPTEFLTDAEERVLGMIAPITISNQSDTMESILPNIIVAEIENDCAIVEEERYERQETEDSEENEVEEINEQPSTTNLTQRQNKLNLTEVASDNINKIMAERNQIIKSYYDKKIFLLEQSLNLKKKDIEVKEKIATSLEIIADSLM